MPREPVRVLGRCTPLRMPGKAPHRAQAALSGYRGGEYVSLSL